MDNYLFPNQHQPLSSFTFGHSNFPPMGFWSPFAQSQDSRSISLSSNSLNLLRMQMQALQLQPSRAQAYYHNFYQEAPFTFRTGNPINSMALIKSEPKLEPFEAELKVEEEQQIPAFPFFVKENEFFLLEKKALEKEVLTMLKFVLENVEKLKREEILEYGRKYLNNSALLNLFYALVEKFGLSTKGKEDLIRFVIRKAISFLRDRLRDKNKMSIKAASMIFCKKYFSSQFSSLFNNEDFIKDEDKLINLLLPYKKNSRNKTANTSFILEIFASEVFYQDYSEFLTKFPGILQEDKDKKIEKFAKFLVEVLQQNNLYLIREFKRVPWLDSWIEATEKIAYDLLNANRWDEMNKKAKPRRDQPSIYTHLNLI